MSEEIFRPSNLLEMTLLESMSAKASVTDFIRAFLNSQIAIPSATVVEEDGSGITPVMFDKEGEQMVAVYTSLERAKRFASQASFCLLMTGSEFVKRVPPGFGIVVNPGHSAGLDISSKGLEEIRNEQ